MKTYPVTLPHISPSQITLAKPVVMSGIGLHSGSVVKLTIHPAPAGHGICFKRLDVAEHTSIVPAQYDLVSDTRLGTTLRNEHGVSVSTVEHLMAALWAAGIDNALIELDAPEVPIMDGSSMPFVAALSQVGLKTLSAKRRVLRVLKKVEISDGESVASIAPNKEGEEGMVIHIEVNYASAVVGRQCAVYDFREQRFEDVLARARTFGFEHEVAALQNAGLALGGSLDNAIVVGKDRVLNAEGLRFDDEFVRHKALDCVGDFFLAGVRIDGCFNVLRPGHHVNNKLLRALLADESAYTITQADSLPDVADAARNAAMALRP